MENKRLFMSENYCLATFPNTHKALQAERILEENQVPFIIVPTPRELSSGCGLAVRVFPQDMEKVVEKLQENGVKLANTYRVNKNGTKSLLEEI